MRHNPTLSTLLRTKNSKSSSVAAVAALSAVVEGCFKYHCLNVPMVNMAASSANVTMEMRQRNKRYASVVHAVYIIHMTHIMKLVVHAIMYSTIPQGVNKIKPLHQGVITFKIEGIHAGR